MAFIMRMAYMAVSAVIALVNSRLQRLTREFRNKNSDMFRKGEPECEGGAP